MDQLTITFITASTALIAGIASPIVSISVARRQFKASVISNNRERWIEALREAIAEYISLVASAALIARHATPSTTTSRHNTRAAPASARTRVGTLPILHLAAAIVITEPTPSGAQRRSGCRLT